MPAGTLNSRESKRVVNGKKPRLPAWFRGLLLSCAETPWLVKLLRSPVQFFYKCILTEVVRVRLPVGVRVLVRHSVLEKEFNPFLSDLDLTIVVPDEQSIKSVALAIPQLLTLFPMLDVPEIHTAQEEARLEQLQLKWSKLFLEVWFLRKLGWIKRDLRLNTEEFEVRKLEISLKKIEKKLGMTPWQQEVQLNSFEVLSSIIQHEEDVVMVCSRLPYLAIEGSGDLIMILSHKEFTRFTSFFPNEKEVEGQSLEWYEAKRALAYYELLLAKNKLRLTLDRDIDYERVAWVKGLELEIEACRIKSLDG